MLALYLGSRTYSAIISRAAVETFKREQLRSPDQNNIEVATAIKPDFTLWSTKRIKEYEESLTTYLKPAIAVLVIPKIKVEVPVLDGTDELCLNRGVGRIAGTASPGEVGNIGIAGHRDGFFRGLKDIALGDAIEMITPRRTDIYTVDHVVIVAPNDTSILRAQSRPSLTLVTCYPFYFVGSAPQRYIVQASLTHSDSETTRIVEQSNTATNNVTQQSSTRSASAQRCHTESNHSEP